MVLLGVLYPIGSILQGAIADETACASTTAGTAVLLGLALVGDPRVRDRATTATSTTSPTRPTRPNSARSARRGQIWVACRAI